MSYFMRYRPAAGPVPAFVRGFETLVGEYERPSLRELVAQRSRQIAEDPNGYDGDATADPQDNAAQAPSAVFDVGPPMNETIDADVMLRGLGFDPSGPGEWPTALGMPLDAFRALRLRWRMDDIVARHFPKDRRHWNDEADAFRHALWSYLVTQEMGAETAKKLGDAHERYDENQTQGGQLMDLFNNNEARRLALDPRNKGRPAEEVILEALRNERLQTRPFRLPEPLTPELQPPGIFLRAPYFNRSNRI